MTRWMVAGLAFAACAGMAALPEVPAEAVAALGSTPGMPQTGGFVFIDGKYLPPPYTVSRRGNGIFINRIQVVQPVPWAGPAQEEEAPKKLDDDGEFKVVEEEKIKAKAAEDDDLLFGDAGNADEKEGAHAVDALFDDTPAAKKKEPERKPPPPTGASLSKQQLDEMRAGLDTVRKRYETTLGQGDFYFFAQHHRPVNGTYGSAKTLFSVLPAALRASQSPQDLMAKLNQGGVYFLDLATCTDLHKNRVTFMQLDERRKQIEADEAGKRGTGRPR